MSTTFDPASRRAETPMKPADRPAGRLFLSRILDGLTVAIAYGWLTGTGMLGGAHGASASISLNGWHVPAFAAIVVAYFMLGRRLGGTPWKRALGIAG